ncbi:polysaccharide biosynthesis protein [Candidatus Laterigemmans baculatus]|uniref:polysaccharide biosynthesis protein n=1 Tax=Candidatus Laterigemmans baculatus TaxID=2770505 RepID=UPI0013DB631F|nr:nucleoside-diphosphate sugar epimerase/dehydratase [Candidatus Laterigemmans baculatus]
MLWLVPTLVLSLVGAYLLRFDGVLLPEFQRQLLMTLPWVVGVKTATFLLGRITLSCHAFVSLSDGVRLLKATLAATAMIATITAIDTLLTPGSTIPRGVILIDSCLTALLVGGLLSLRRICRERREAPRDKSDAVPVLIAGGTTSVELMLRSLRLANREGYRPTGLLTDRDRLLHREISGVPVVGGLDEAAEIALRTGTKMVLLGSGDLPGARVRAIMAACEAVGVAVRVLPDVAKIVSGQVDFRPREVAIEDLLGRETVAIDQSGLLQWIAGRRLLVTGSCGSIGSELVRQLLAFDPAHITLVDRSENGQFHLGLELRDAIARGQAEIAIADVTDKARMESLMQAARPELVFHAAAYKHVPLMEQHPGEGVKNIVGATRLLADLADQYGVQTFVMISTDKAVNPTSVMGCCKRVAELYVQSLAERSRCRFVTVRFGNVLGSAGSVIPVFREQIARGGPLTVTDQRMTRFFMTIPEASQLVIQASALGQGGEIFVLDMGEPVRIMDLAEDMIRLSGLRLGHDIEIQISGLRPGEKLYEELYAEDETHSETIHPKILMANSVRVSRQTVARQIASLLAVGGADPTTIRCELKRIVPSFAFQDDSQVAEPSPTPAAARAFSPSNRRLAA